ncbi:MAG: cysteine-rich KTR domain-containing protein [Lachnospiraceae bacterium]|nr:cysteine-rich KTR domain-containing protein [Lachnospiraceae bacterium]MDE6625358.1 cysteine-rich KTR domain-containing protein [Lachnospiraceae bacterium]
MVKMKWIFCPVCGNKTRNQIREDTVLLNFPLYCPKCKQETLIETKKFQVTVIEVFDKKQENKAE